MNGLFAFHENIVQLSRLVDELGVIDRNEECVPATFEQVHKVDLLTLAFSLYAARIIVNWLCNGVVGIRGVSESIPQPVIHSRPKEEVEPFFVGNELESVSLRFCLQICECDYVLAFRCHRAEGASMGEVVVGAVKDCDIQQLLE